MEKLANTVKTITNIGLVLTLMVTFVQYVLSDSQMGLDFFYYYYFFDSVKWDLIVFLLVLTLILNLKNISFLNYTKLGTAPLFFLGILFVICVGGSIYLRQNEVYGFLVQKRRYYFHTLRANYFQYLVSESTDLEKQGLITPALARYKRMKGLFPNHPDIAIIDDKVKKLENRRDLSISYYRNYKQFKPRIDLVQERSEFILYAYYLNPESEEVKKGVINEFNKMKSTFKEVKNNIEGFSYNLCDLSGAYDRENRTFNLLIPEDLLRVDVDWSMFSSHDCFNIQSKNIDQVKDWWYYSQFEEAVKSIAN